MSSKAYSRGLILAAVFFLFISVTPSIAQKKVKVRISEFGVLKGYFLETFDSSGIVLSIDSQRVAIPFDNIKVIRFYDPSNKKPHIGNLDSFPQLERGYYHTIGLGLTFSEASPGVSLSMVNGYNFNRWFNAGIGLGIDQYDDMNTIPIFAEMKGYLKKGKFIPYYFLRPGYGFLSNVDGQNETSKKGGIHWQAGVGYQINFYETAMSFSLAHVGQNATVSYIQPDWWGDDGIHIIEKRMKRRISFRIELLF